MRQPNRLGALLPFDSGENAINPNAGILKISKQISDRYPFTINADQTEIHFTLNQNNLAVENYLETAKNGPENERSVIHCIVDTVIGAASAAGVDFPSNWCSMWPEYTELGKKLSSQTADAAKVVRRLISETAEHFPDFKNPYTEQ